MKITESQLRHIISESLKELVSENVEGNEQLEEIFREADIKAYRYRQYAEQLEADLEKVETICNDIVDAVNHTFGMSITTKDFKNCWKDEDLYFTIYIPVQNFLKGCKENYEVMKSFKFEEQQDEQTLLGCGLNENWGDSLYTSDGAQIGDGWHKFSFAPGKVQNNMIECSCEITNTFVNYD